MQFCTGIHVRGGSRKFAPRGWGGGRQPDLGHLDALRGGNKRGKERVYVWCPPPMDPPLHVQFEARKCRSCYKEQVDYKWCPGGGHSDKNICLHVCTGGLQIPASNGPISLKSMMEESRPFQSHSLQDAPLSQNFSPKFNICAWYITGISKKMIPLSLNGIMYVLEWVLQG